MDIDVFNSRVDVGGDDDTALRANAGGINVASSQPDGGTLAVEGGTGSVTCVLSYNTNFQAIPSC